ncbi:MAG: hypothetical protein WAM98_06335, partial [Terriglobales bacterium]
SNMILELFDESTFRFQSSVDHPDVAEKVREFVAAEVFFRILPFCGVRVALDCWNAADNF